jgi:glycine C-acetyltransferase
VTAAQPVVDLLRQRSRPYLFSNSLPPAIAGGALKALELNQAGTALRATLQSNTAYFRQRLDELGFVLLGGEHPIIPVMLGDAALAQAMAAKLGNLGVYVSGFFYPVVPLGKARIRVQISAEMSKEILDSAAESFEIAGKDLGVI